MFFYSVKVKKINVLKSCFVQVEMVHTLTGSSKNICVIVISVNMSLQVVIIEDWNGHRNCGHAVYTWRNLSHVIYSVKLFYLDDRLLITTH